MRKRLFIAVLLVVATAALASSTRQDGPQNEQQELVQLAQRRFKAFFEGDAATYRQIVAKDAVFAYSNGRVLNYTEALRELEPLAKPGSFDFHYEDIQFRDLGGGAMLLYRLVFNGPEGAYEGWESDTFAHRDQGWVLVAVHGTTIPYPNRANLSVEPKLLDEYVGRYAGPQDAYYEITRQGNQLFGQRSGFPKVPWSAESSDIFYVPSDPYASRVFMRDARGRISKLVRIEVTGNTVWTRMK